MSEATAPVRDSARADLIGPRVILPLTSPAAPRELGEEAPKIQSHPEIQTAGQCVKPNNDRENRPRLEFERRLTKCRPPRRSHFGGFCFLGRAFQKLVDVGSGIEQLVRDRQSGHQHQPLVADVAVLAHQLFELGRQILRDFFEPMNFVIATRKAIAAPVEID